MCPIVVMPPATDSFALPKQLLLLAFVPLLLLAAGREPRPTIPRRLALGLGFVLAVELLSFASAPDRFGAILGSSGYRFGLATHLAVLAVLATAAMTIRDLIRLRRTLLVAAVGVVPLVLYAILQSLNLDFVDWNTGGSERVFSTIGNANDLAAYCALSTAFVGLALGWRVKHRYLAAGAMVVALTTVIVLTQSRSGLVAFAFGLICLPLLATLNHWPATERNRMSAALGGAVALAILAGVALGTTGRLGERFTGSFSTSQLASDSIRTRWDIWRGSFAVGRAYPLLGAGQDGLLVQFNRYRPADLGSPFSEFSPTGSDPLVASPHNAVLEAAVTVGLAGLASIAVVSVAAVQLAWSCLREQRSQEIPFVLSGLIAYVVSAMFNPMSLPAVVLAALLLGGLLGIGAQSSGTSLLECGVLSRAGTRVTLWVAVAAAIGFGIVHLRAEFDAYSAIEAAGSQDWSKSAEKASSAAHLMPFERTYRRADVAALLNEADATKNDALLSRANHAQQLFLEDFPGLATDFVTLARIRIELGLPDQHARVAAHNASPYGVNTAYDLAGLAASRSQ